LLENVRCREFLDNSYTIEGTNLHQRVHTVGAENREEIWKSGRSGSNQTITVSSVKPI
jgi:hypothetical protein